MLKSQLSVPVSAQWNQVLQICAQEPRFALLTPSALPAVMNWLAMQIPENP